MRQRCNTAQEQFEMGRAEMERARGEGQEQVVPGDDRHAMR
jgi:hypothetical protein